MAQDKKAAVSRRDFLLKAGATALALLAGSSYAQRRPFFVSRRFGGGNGDFRVISINGVPINRDLSLESGKRIVNFSIENRIEDPEKINIDMIFTSYMIGPDGQILESPYIHSTYIGNLPPTFYLSPEFNIPQDHSGRVASLHFMILSGLGYEWDEANKTRIAGTSESDEIVHDQYWPLAKVVEGAQTEEERQGAYRQIVNLFNSLREDYSQRISQQRSLPVGVLGEL